MPTLFKGAGLHSGERARTAMAAELKTEFWASALLRRASDAGAFAAIVRKGDADAGAVLVKVASMDGRARLYAPARDGSGERIWLDLSSGGLGDDEREIDAQAQKRAATDPDLWLIEIEDKHGRHFLQERVDRG
jgi:hypothetical protein